VDSRAGVQGPTAPIRRPGVHVLSCIAHRARDQRSSRDSHASNLPPVHTLTLPRRQYHRLPVPTPSSPPRHMRFSLRLHPLRLQTPTHSASAAAAATRRRRGVSNHPYSLGPSLFAAVCLAVCSAVLLAVALPRYYTSSPSSAWRGAHWSAMFIGPTGASPGVVRLAVPKTPCWVCALTPVQDGLYPGPGDTSELLALVISTGTLPW